MAKLEKIISYSSAILEPETELEKFENNTKIRLKPLENLIYLCHFDGDREYYEPWYELKDEIHGLGIFQNNALLWKGISKFGLSSLISVFASSTGHAYGEISPELVGLKEGTIDFWFAKDEQQNGVDFIKRGHWGNNDDTKWKCSLNVPGYLVNSLGFSLWTDQGRFDLIAEELPIESEVWYHYRATWSEAYHTFKLFLNGEEIASGNFEGSIAEEFDPLKSPYLVFFSNQSQDSGIGLDELRIYNDYKPEEFTPPEEPTKPFSQNQPKAKLSLDSKVINACWDLSSLEFFDESDFENEGIKIRVDADDDNSPNFSGNLLTLEEARNLGEISGRYLHLEFCFLSDGDSQRVLYSGKISLKSHPLILLRRAPEIIPRF